MTRRMQSEAGFSLIETMVAVVIFAIGGLALAALIPLATRNVTDSGEFSRASSLAEERCETLLTTPYASTDLDPGLHNDPENPHDAVYFVRWNVEADQPIAGCKRVTVTVHRPSLAAPALTRLVVVVPEAGS